jgi:copper chaperone CopZ
LDNFGEIVKMSFKAFIITLVILNLNIRGFSQFRDIEIQAAGLTCSLCSNAIQKALKGLPFVSGVQTELKQNLFKIDLRPGIPVDLDMISKKVEDAGFSIGKMTMEVRFGNLDIENDSHAQIAGTVFHFLNVKPQKIDGWQKLQLIDKHFLLASEAKKYTKITSMECYKTGVTSPACSLPGLSKGQRIYHVTI